MEVTREGLARFCEVVLPHLNERQRRVVAGAASEMLGRGGKSAVAEASRMSRNTVIKAEKEVAAGIEPSERLRAPGGGDKSLLETQPGLLEALDELVQPETRGNPMSHLRWTSKSSTNLAADLVRQGFAVSSRSKTRFPRATRLLITADAGGSNGYPVRAWKVELAKLAKDTGLEITVGHYPPGTSKWNRVVIYTGIRGVYEVTNEPAPEPQLLARARLSASRP